MEEMENMKNLVESLLEKYLIFAADSKIKEEFGESIDNLAECAKALQEFADNDLLLLDSYTPEIEERINDCLAALGYAVMGMKAIYLSL